MSDHVLVVLDLDADGHVRGHRFVEPRTPILSAVELAATRGDGVFETISIGRGHPQALGPHLERFARSAELLDLPAIDPEGWRGVVGDVGERFADASEAWVKTVFSRGVEGAGVPSGWAWAERSADFSAARRDGIRVVLLDRGWSSDVAERSPWLLAGAKTVSYAVNLASKREAARRGADDVVFVSTDGVLLEGPTSNLLARIDGTLVTPPPELGILFGTSQRDAFRWAESSGIPTAYRRLTLDDLPALDAAWLISSVRHAAPVRALDARVLPVDAEMTASLNDFLVARTE